MIKIHHQVHPHHQDVCFRWCNIFLRKGKWDSLYCISDVRFNKITPKAISEYIATGSPMDKAGAYGIQDQFGMLNIEYIKGSYTNIIGLPVTQVTNKMAEILKN